MLIPNHPHDEKLSALASGDRDALADSTLSAHIADCPRCTATVDDLRGLRASLAELPDLRPHRPLRLLPEVTDEPSRVDRLGGWARRFFAPALTAGAALAMVGLVGTAGPILSGGSAGAAPQLDTTLQAPGGGADEGGAEEGAGGGAPAAEPTVGVNAYSQSGDAGRASPDDGQERLTADDGDGADAQLPAERSPWPMVLFTGVAVMIAAALLRWILVPRAG